MFNFNKLKNQLLLLKTQSGIKSILRLAIVIIPLYLTLLLLNISSLYFPAVLFLVTAIYLLFYNQLWLLLAIIPLTLPFGQLISVEIAPGWAYEMNIGEAILLIISAVWLLGIIMQRDLKRYKIGNTGIILSAYLVLALSSYFYIIDFRLYVFGIKVIVLSLLAYVLARNLIDTKQKIKCFLYSIAFAAFILSAQLLSTFYQLGFSSRFFLERNLITVPMGPLALAVAALALLIPVVFSAALAKKRTEGQWLFFIAATTGVLSAFLSLGKGAILSLCLGLGYLIAKSRVRRAPLALAAVTLFFIGYYFFSVSFEGLFIRLGRAFIDSSTQFRLLEYKAAWNIIKQHLLFGVGSGQQIIHYARTLMPGYRELANNFFLQAALDLGIAGLTTMLILAAVIFKNVRAKINSYPHNILVYGFAASLVVAFFNGLVEVTFFVVPYAILFWLLSGIFNNIEKYE
jgi:O-antigen ligase